MATLATPRKCANAACSCMVQDRGKYCSAHCEGIAQKVELMCTCGHAGCDATISVYQPIERDDPQPPASLVH